jgi:predicted Zn-dependent protease
VSARRAVALPLLLALPACSALKELPGGDLIAAEARRNAEVVGQNLVRSAATGELQKTAELDMAQEHHLGRTVAATVIGRLGGRALPPGHPVTVYLRDVGTTVALAAAELRTGEDRPAPLRGWRFIPVEADVPNAVGCPGGLVVVTTALVRATRSEDELAAVLAHEVAHVQRGHTVQPVEAARRQEHLTGELLKGTSDVVHAFFGEAVRQGADFVLDRGFGKRDELEADALAARVLAEAGYDPRALPTFLGRLTGAAARGGFFARHPPAAERVRALASVASRPAPAARRARFERALAALPR